MVGWFRGRRAGQRLAIRTCRPQENAGNPHYLPTAAAHRAIRPRRARAARSLGQARPAGRGLCRHHLGRLSPARRVPERVRQGVRGDLRRARRRRRAGAGRGARRPRAARLRGRSRGRRRCCATPATPTASCTGPATASARRCTATACNMDDYETHDDRRLLPGTGFTIEPGVYFDDFGVRTEINMVVARARRGGDRAAADRDSGTRLVREIQTDVNPQDHRSSTPC